MTHVLQKFIFLRCDLAVLFVGRPDYFDSKLLRLVGFLLGALVL